MANALLDQMVELIDLFSPSCADKTTLHELKTMIRDEDSWGKAHALFGRIRRKRIPAEEQEHRLECCQYAFEEICAKTLFNLTNTDKPFDPDSPYWVVPIALQFARALGINESEVVMIVAD